eukprot:230187-Prymnesium_polylepis.2
MEKLALTMMPSSPYGTPAAAGPLRTPTASSRARRAAKPSTTTRDAPRDSGASDDGEAATFEFRRFLSSDGGRVSYWHDVPLHAPGGGFHAVIEIPRMTKSKVRGDAQRPRARAADPSAARGVQCAVVAKDRIFMRRVQLLRRAAAAALA